MEGIKESWFAGNPLITYENTKRIVQQMERNICKIKIDDVNQGTGFFCKIPFPNKNDYIFTLITSNHVIDKNILDNNNSRSVKLYIEDENRERIFKLHDRIIYTDIPYDITILEIKKEEEINNYLEFK